MGKCERCEEHKPMGGTYVATKHGVIEVMDTICSDCETELEDRRQTDRAAGMMWH